MGQYVTWNTTTGGDVVRYIRREVLDRVVGELAAADQDALINGLIDAAEGEVNAAISQAAAVPLSPAPPEVVNWTAALVAEALYRRSGNVPDEVTAAAENIRTTLDAIREGSRPVVMADGTVAVAGGTSGVLYDSGDTDSQDLADFGG